jgi:hypothetical protein
MGSSSEANSSVSFATAKIVGEKIEELDETMENLDLGDQLEDLMICYDDALDKSTYTWKTGLELHEDDKTIFSSFNSKLDNRYQVLAILGDNLEEFDNNNPVLNPANINKGANHLAEGETADSLASGEKVRLSVEEWNTIKTAIEHGVPIPTNASKNMLLGYHYALRQQSKQLARERSERQKKGKIQPSQQAQLFIKQAAMHRIQIAKGTIGTYQELKTSNTQKGEASPKTSTHPSYRLTSKAISYQRHQRQCLWQHKRICIQHDQV